MSRTAARITQADVARSIRAAMQAGLRVTRVTVNQKDGSITLDSVENPTTPHMDSPETALATSWDDA